MKLIVSGSENSKKIISASSYLMDKYFKDMFDVYWLNYGGYTNQIFCGEYISLDDHQFDAPASWSRYTRDYLETLTDDIILLGFEDMLISGYPNITQYNKLLDMVKGDIVCAKLCTSDFHKPEEYEMLDDTIMQLNSTAEFSAVGQYCLWNRKFLIDLLRGTTDAWNFEGLGSKLLNETGRKVIGTKIPTIPYPDRSAMSWKNWPEKIRIVGNPKEDIDYLLDQGYLQKEDVIYD